ncbi:unnamed protein product [Brachionus calyciflorus]|uniref:Chitin-binding type-2 domain-containing protein n=1 Tax=Brachionus calyciflorus TaxID=104777 RepID=A0A814NY22_9BILA|nr:unnamed protein product [Brachionus calyciflorus]
MFSVTFLIALFRFQKALSINWLGHYAFNCDFTGYDIRDQIVGNYDECLRICFANPFCTHYSYRPSDNWCYQKSNYIISREMAIEKNDINCGIVDRTMQCLEMMDHSPLTQNCSFYYKCVNFQLSLVSCSDNKLFDPFTKQCSINSDCYHGCRNSTDKVGIALKTNQYYDCETSSINYCEDGQSFDLKERKCLRKEIKYIFEYKSSQKFSNFLLGERRVFAKRLCLNWCIRIFYCKIFQYENNVCKIFDEQNSGSATFDLENVYIPRELSLE